MKKLSTLIIAGAVGALAGCAGISGGDKAASVASNRPITKDMPTAAPSPLPPMPWSEKSIYQASGPHTINMRGVPIGIYSPSDKLAAGWGQNGPRRIPSPISEAEADALRAAAKNLPASDRVHRIGQTGPSGNAPTPTGVNFDGLDYNECCGGGGNVPPDPEMAAGPNHVIAVVNVAFKIWDKSGNLLVGPTTLSSFFDGTPGCSFANTFDPNVLYDEEADRFMIGADGNGTDYCVAVSQTGDPLGSWNAYGFPTNISGAFFDYPHAGIGVDAIFMGSNQFGGTLPGGFEARVFAMDKAAMYAGAPLTVATHSTGNDSTPQPMNLHGVSDGTFPTSGPHYILTEVFDGANHTVWTWEDPFGTNVLTRGPNMDLNAATGVTAGFPLDTPQSGSAALLQANDWRGQDAEFRNGFIYMVNSISCNPGSGAVNCVRWAQIEPSTSTIVDAGVFGTDGEYRIFGDVGVNECGDMAVGYTKSSSSMFPGIYVTGREATDAPGTVQAEILMKDGEIAYDAFDGSPHRWGDYTGMTSDPDGQTFWYLGEYSKVTGNPSGRWGTYVGSFTFPACGGVEPSGIEITTTGVRARSVTCNNLTTGDTVSVQDTASTVSCTDLGLAASPGDSVSIQAQGFADAAMGVIGGSTLGMQNMDVRCRNASTGQQVQGGVATPNWSCEDLGLTATNRDAIQQTVRGTAQ